MEKLSKEEIDTLLAIGENEELTKVEEDALMDELTGTTTTAGENNLTVVRINDDLKSKIENLIDEAYKRGRADVTQTKFKTGDVVRDKNTKKIGTVINIQATLKLYTVEFSNVDIETIPEERLENYEEYQRGLDDAWNAARKIGCCQEDGGMSGKDLYEIFSMSDTTKILSTFEASDAMEKIACCEKKDAAEEIKVGDEVEYGTGKRGIVLSVTPDGVVYIIQANIPNTFPYALQKVGDLKRTGRTFAETIK